MVILMTRLSEYARDEHQLDNVCMQVVKVIDSKLIGPTGEPRRLHGEAEGSKETA